MKRFTLYSLAIGGAITATIGAASASWTVGENIRKARRERDRMKRRIDANRQHLLAMEAGLRGGE